MAGVIPSSLESYAGMDGSCMAGYFEQIWFKANAHGHVRQRCNMDGHRNRSLMGYLAEKNLGCEIADRRCDRLHDLVLVRTAHLAKSSSKLGVRCYSKSDFNCLRPIHYEIHIERGT